MNQIVRTVLFYILDKVIARFTRWIRSRKRIAKNNKIINEEFKGVERALKVIQEKNSKGEPLGDDDIQNLKNASRKLNGGFFN